MRRIQFGAHYAPVAANNVMGPVEFAEQAEAYGYDSFWVPETLTGPRMDPLVVLAATAQRTQQILLGTAVLILPIRSPFHLAKAALSVDVLSNGRLILGVGVGGPAPKDFEVEGVDFHQRGRMTNERLDVILKLLAEPSVSHNGRYHEFQDVTVGPRSVQKPHIPVWVCASWNNGIADRVLRRAARYGDGFLIHDASVEEYKRAQDKIKAYAKSYGRDPHNFQWAFDIYTYLGNSKHQALNVVATQSRWLPLEERSGLSRDLRPERGYALGTAQDCIETIRGYVDLGITHFILFAICPPDQILPQYELLAKEVTPHLRGRT